ncbi:MAG: prepilin-type N-terminal cleavage/methylation domain-containing protein [Proteobacteria bacterium]|nr:prepilin-type N-terminal cleavage/methylation domain-containing protein [Pseudomonadota bacterium]
MRVNQAACQAKQSGFTLVELAIVLVIIGLILGMAFKGKDLIDGAKVKSIAAQYNKVQAAFNIYFERYGSFPGDGCGAPPALGAAFAPCPVAGVRNGLLNNANEANSAMILLQNANLLSAADVQSPFGGPWRVTSSGNTVLNAGVGNMNFLSMATNGVPQATADARFVCALDRLIDDGINTSGNVRSTTAPYNAATDCWGPALVGVSYNVGMRLLP